MMVQTGNTPTNKQFLWGSDSGLPVDTAFRGSLNPLLEDLPGATGLQLWKGSGGQSR